MESLENVGVCSFWLGFAEMFWGLFRLLAEIIITHNLATSAGYIAKVIAFNVHSGQVSDSVRIYLHYTSYKDNFYTKSASVPRGCDGEDKGFYAVTRSCNLLYGKPPQYILT